MVKLTKIYTRGGDKGQTSLGNSARVPKNDRRVAAYGTVDEVNSIIGVARLNVSDEVDIALARIQNDLFDLGADLCTPEAENPKYPPLRISKSQIVRLELEIDEINRHLSPLNSFILPGGTPASAYLHLARTVARRAERDIVELSQNENVSDLCTQYMNRLSDYLFVLARKCNSDGVSDVLWVPGANR
ncbi:cob(I)yrinic acid a,c-diamide adenosyltransferase [Aliirhizobium smilacinae]|uniref:Corrinoid adenosyltransferase n=1 Tax=Aliirhizobium smilacinae TaxID=1395944 RepID=A0A5C4X900_9HYPH|nr:cob(I)yrinic acid a,c-diamide adenosyltransferase [Rhizobium smilacinae]TNM59916.1 cob(I)yrinic acid a,c-diamide adenosyltransferase [Rhizobium smilacinae]